MPSSSAIDVQAVIDDRPFGRFQLLVAASCALIVFVDGFDTQAIGYVAPAITAAFHVERTALGPVFSAGLFGLMIGALTFGPLADRFGRKPVLVFCTLFFGVLSLLTALADSLGPLLLCRFITGLGLGGAMPNAIALTSEYTPHRIRATAVMVMFCGFSLGAAFGGLAAAALVTRFGWKSVFVLGGIVPCVAVPLLAVSVPESIRYLVLRTDRNREVAEVLSKIDPGIRLDPAATYSVSEHRSGRFIVGQLFAAGRTLVTLLLWVVFFMSLLDLYFVSNWLPTVIHDAGLPLDRAAIITAMFQIGGAAGGLALGRVFDNYAPFRVLAAIYLAASGLVLLIGSAVSSIGFLAATVFGAGFCIVGGQTGANALAAHSYPTAIRATGVGWALGIGRVGSIVGPMAGGLLLSFEWETRQLFMLGALPVLVAAAAAFAIDRNSRRTTQNS